MAIIPKNPFILVDGSSYLFRAYHALPPLSTAQGQPTGAIFGVINMLRRLCKDYQPQKMAVVFDSKEKNFRHALYEQYKANRSMMPEELQAQIQPLFSLIRAMGLPLIIMPGIEADDIIGTLAKQAQKQGLFTLISTGDKDFAQLVDEDIYLINTMSQDIFDRARVIEKFQVPPEKMIDYLAMIGDSVDNIPGIPNVGPKTAVKWLEAYGTLENIIQKADTISGKVGEHLKNNLDKLPLYRDLVTIDVNLDLNLHVNELTVHAGDHSHLLELYQALEFKTWAKELKEKTQCEILPQGSAASSDESSSDASIERPLQYKTLLTETEFNAWIETLKHAPLFSLEVFTNHEDYMQAPIVGIAFAIHKNVGAYLPLGHECLGAPKQLSHDWVFSRLKNMLEDPNHLKVGHNVKYLIEVFANYGIHLKGSVFDTMLESYVLDSIGSRHTLTHLAEKYLNQTLVPLEDLVGKGAKKIEFSQTTVESATELATSYAHVILQLHTILIDKLKAIPRLKEVLETIEMPLVDVLVKMERGGVHIDAGILQEQSKSLGQRMQQLESEVYSFSKAPFNLNSSKQLGDVLYAELGYPILEKTPTGQASTAESVLEKLALDFPLPNLILEYRSLTKLKSTYTDKLPELINPTTHRVHTSYHQAVTSTGRLSSSDPNLQNIPIRTAEGRKIRSAFTAPPGYKIVSADYSQIELRIMAHLSQDQGLVHAFSQGDDIHRTTASKIFNVPLENVTAEQRRNAKAINFGLMYGMSNFGLARQLGIEQKEAEQHMAYYFQCFPKVKAFMDYIRKHAEACGYVETLFGRRLYLPDLKSRNMALKRAAERAAINAPMQGTNADIIKLVMIELMQWIESSKAKVKMIMQVHDELVFEVHESELESTLQKIKSVMENKVTLSVKLRVDIGVGDSWEVAESH